MTRPDDDLLDSPVSNAKLDRVLAQLRLSRRDRLLDVGCGSGGLLVRAHELCGCAGVGIDKDPEAIRRGKARVDSVAPDADIDLHAMEAGEFSPVTPFDAAACVGATHVFGGFPGTLLALKGYVRPGGYVLVGDLYWRLDPGDEYLAVLGEARENHFNHHGNVMAGIEEGLTPLYTAVSSEDDWDHFEGRFWAKRLRAEPGATPDPKLLEKRQRAMRWLNAYLSWGRDTLGVGLYLFQT
jgi:SAM-dependent methyltransferase